MKEILKKEEFKVVKHNSLINIQTKTPYTLNQLKLICHLISNIKPMDTNFEVKEIALKELGFVGANSENHTYFKEEFVKLLEMPFKLPNSRWWVNWFSALACEKGIVEYAFDERLKPFLLELKDNFTSYQLKNILLLKSAYSIRMYELLNQYKIIGKRTIEIKELRELLNIPNGYKNPNITKLINSIKEELNLKTDLTFDFKPIKRIKEFVAFEFTIKHNKKLNKNLNAKDKLKSLKIEDVEI